MTQQSEFRGLASIQHLLLEAAIARYYEAGIQACSGVGLRDAVQDLVEDDINDRRLYANLDALVDRGLLEETALDDRTNAYQPTPEGETLVSTECARRIEMLPDHLTTRPTAPSPDGASHGGQP